MGVGFLQSSNKILEKIFSNTHLCLVLLDSEFNFIRVNRAYADIYRYEPGFFVGKNYFDLYPNEEEKSIFHRVVETEVPYTIYGKACEFPEMLEQDITYWDWTLNPVKNTAFAKVENIILSMVDVTERKQFELELEKQKSLLKKKTYERTQELTNINDRLEAKIFEQQNMERVLRLIVDGTACVTGKDFFRSLVRNLADATGFRYVLLGKLQPDGASIKTITVWRGGKNLENFVYNLAGTPCEDVIKNGMCYYPRNIQQLFQKDCFLANTFESYIGIPLVNSSNVVIGILSALHDKPMDELPFAESIMKIFSTRTAAEMEREAIEEEIKQARYQAEKANKIKSEFLANMSHEIRTPMNGIIGFANIMMESDLTEDQKESLRIIKSSADNLLEIINNILDISKIESGKLTLEEIDFDLEILVYDVCNLTKVRLENKPVEVLADIDNIPTTMFGDPTQLRQIITNLMGNACKFTKSGEIVLKVSLLEETKDCLILRFSVRDTGIGIPEDKVDSIFSSFTQVDTSTTRKFGGTGLGLSISKKLAAIMGGEMWVESTFGKGSTFYFTTKFKRVHSNIEKIIPLRPEKLFGKRVVVIEDNPTALDINTRLIESFGMKAISFTSALSAVEYLENSDLLPDLCIVGIVMRDINGFEFIKEVRKNSKFSSMPLIAVTAKSTHGMAKIYEDAGFSGYLPKPIRRSSFLDVICTVLGIKTERREKSETPLRIVTQHSVKKDILRNASILLAEDNIINQKLVVRVLDKYGCKVDIADDGLIAIEKLKKGTYNLVFMDMQMPNMGGIEATKAIRKTGNTIPIIAMTANAMKGDKERCIEAGMNDYLTKPIKIEDVIGKIQKWRESQVEVK